MPTAALDRSPLPVEFLEDWRDDHRPLTEANRAAAGRYIGQIVARDGAAGSDRTIARVLAIELWVRFRETYDGYRGPFVRSDSEDFARAMVRL